MDNKLNNPLFESLLKQANKYKEIPKSIVIKEQNSAISLTEEEVKSTLYLILTPLLQNIVLNIQSIPDQTIKDEIMPEAIGEVIKLSDNKSIDDLITSLEKIWKEVALTFVKKYTDSTSIIDPEGNLLDINKKVTTGVTELINAYKLLKEKEESKLANAELLKAVNGTMKTFNNSLIEAIKSAKTTILTASK